MQLRVYGHFNSEEIAAMTDQEYRTQLAHLARIRQAESKMNAALHGFKIED